MDEAERERWAEQARPVIESLREQNRISDLSRASGVSRQTIYRLLDGGTPQTSTVKKLTPVLDSPSFETHVTFGVSPDDRADVVSGEGWSADPEGSQAEQLIHRLQHPELLRRFSGTPSMKDAVKAAFAIAVDEDFPDEEMNKLQAWRRDVLSQESE